MKEQPEHPFKKFLNEIPIIGFKGFIVCLGIGLVLEIIGIDLLAGKSIYTHGWEIFGTIFAVGFPLHYFIWR